MEVPKFLKQKKQKPPARPSSKCPIASAPTAPTAPRVVVGSRTWGAPREPRGEEGSRGGEIVVKGNIVKMHAVCVQET